MGKPWKLNALYVSKFQQKRNSGPSGDRRMRFRRCGTVPRTPSIDLCLAAAASRRHPCVIFVQQFLRLPVIIIQYCDLPADLTLDGIIDMSETHAPHDHAVEHAAHAGDSLSRWVAVFTAILAGISGWLHYEESVLQTKSLLYKNEAVLLQSKASDQWNLYQAQSSKGHMMEIAEALTDASKQAYYHQQIEKYEQRKKSIAVQARAMEQQVETANQKSAHLENPQHMFGRALALINVAISLAAITSLTGSRRLFVLAGATGLAGIGVSLTGFLQV
jgi:hypothetical protein